MNIITMLVTELGLVSQITLGDAGMYTEVWGHNGARPHNWSR